MSLGKIQSINKFVMKHSCLKKIHNM